MSQPWSPADSQVCRVAEGAGIPGEFYFRRYHRGRGVRQRQIPWRAPRRGHPGLGPQHRAGRGGRDPPDHAHRCVGWARTPTAHCGCRLATQNWICACCIRACTIEDMSYSSRTFSCCLLPAQAERLEWLHAECTGRTVKADVAVADAFALPYREGTCDGVLCIAVLHHIASEPRRLRLLQQLAHILRPGKSLTLLLAGP